MVAPSNGNQGPAELAKSELLRRRDELLRELSRLDESISEQVGWSTLRAVPDEQLRDGLTIRGDIVAPIEADWEAER